MNRFALPMILIFVLSSMFIAGCQCNRESSDPVLKNGRIPEIHKIYDVTLSPEEVQTRMNGVAEKLGIGIMPSAHSALDSTVSFNTIYCDAELNAFRRSEQVTRVLVKIRISAGLTDKDAQQYIQHVFDTYIHDALADAIIPQK